MRPQEVSVYSVGEAVPWASACPLNNPNLTKEFFNRPLVSDHSFDQERLAPDQRTLTAQCRSPFGKWLQGVVARSGELRLQVVAVVAVDAGPFDCFAPDCID